jgi:hypothetical protein
MHAACMQQEVQDLTPARRMHHQASVRARRSMQYDAFDDDTAMMRRARSAPRQRTVRHHQEEDEGDDNEYTDQDGAASDDSRARPAARAGLRQDGVQDWPRRSAGTLREGSQQAYTTAETEAPSFAKLVERQRSQQVNAQEHLFGSLRDPVPVMQPHHADHRSRKNMP